MNEPFTWTVLTVLVFISYLICGCAPASRQSRWTEVQVVDLRGNGVESVKAFILRTYGEKVDSKLNEAPPVSDRCGIMMLRNGLYKFTDNGERFVYKNISPCERSCMQVVVLPIGSIGEENIQSNHPQYNDYGGSQLWNSERPAREEH